MKDIVKEIKEAELNEGVNELGKYFKREKENTLLVRSRIRRTK